MEENTVNAVQETVVGSQENVSESVHDGVATSQTQEPNVADKGQSPEENSKFAEIRRKMEADKAEAVKQAKLEAQKELIKNEFGFDSIDEYRSAKEQREIQRRAEEFMNEGLSEEYAKQLAESEKIKRDNEKLTKEQREKKELEERISKENNDFLEYYKSVNGKEYSKAEGLPDAVWEKVNAGTPLKYAYMEHTLEQIKLGTQQQQTNEQHSKQTTGSVQGVDNVPDKPLTVEDIANMSDKELAKPENWARVKKLLNMR